MRKDLTEVVFILDRSGSMAGLEADTIGGFNGMIEKQRKEQGEAVAAQCIRDLRRNHTTSSSHTTSSNSRRHRTFRTSGRWAAFRAGRADGGEVSRRAMPRACTQQGR